MPTPVKILDIRSVTHNVRRYTVEKPEGFVFEPGQATEVSLDLDGWRDRKRPFTFTALAEWPALEFTIKSYFDHDGVTARLGRLEAGASLLLRDVWGTITYKGPGTFIAGGAGVTPFIAILRRLHKDGRLAGNRLIFSNRTERDIILRDEFEAMEGLERLFTLTEESVPGLLHERIDADFLKRHVKDFSGNFYVCGPDKMVGQLRDTLKQLGAEADSVTFEK
ncbi:MAG TPA: flavodoxin reductase [Devosiaceae bacterium]